MVCEPMEIEQKRGREGSRDERDGIAGCVDRFICSFNALYPGYTRYLSR